MTTTPEVDWHAIPGCTCDIFDIGPRCDACVAVCTAAGHPYMKMVTNGEHHWCGVRGVRS